MKKSLPGDKIYEAWVLLRRVCDAIYVARSKDLRRIGISPTEAGCLFIIRLKENMVTPAEIARYLFRQPHSISGLINRMDKKGLVTKNKDLPRKNQIRVALTEKGERVYSQSTNRKSINRILSALSKEELEQFTSYLKKLRAEALKEIKVDIALSFPE